MTMLGFIGFIVVFGMAHFLAETLLTPSEKISEEDKRKYMEQIKKSMGKGA